MPFHSEVEEQKSDRLVLHKVLCSGALASRCPTRPVSKRLPFLRRWDMHGMGRTRHLKIRKAQLWKLL